MQQIKRRYLKPTKPGYKVTNWREYNAALVARGSLTLWFDESVIANWHDVSGKGFIYHDGVIQCALSLRSVLNLTLRQTQGFLQSLKQLLGLTGTVPHCLTFSRRAAGLSIPKPTRCKGPIHLVVDSTGLKVFGEGEWKVRTHGTEKHKRRVWRKLHLGNAVAVDEASNER